VFLFAEIIRYIVHGIYFERYKMLLVHVKLATYNSLISIPKITSISIVIFELDPIDPNP
jgi:hypothetical protein